MSYVISARSEINLAQFRAFNHSFLIALSTRAITGRDGRSKNHLKIRDITDYAVPSRNSFHLIYRAASQKDRIEMAARVERIIFFMHPR